MCQLGHIHSSIIYTTYPLGPWVSWSRSQLTSDRRVHPGQIINLSQVLHKGEKKQKQKNIRIHTYGQFRVAVRTRLFCNFCFCISAEFNLRLRLFTQCVALCIVTEFPGSIISSPFESAEISDCNALAHGSASSLHPFASLSYVCKTAPCHQTFSQSIKVLHTTSLHLHLLVFFKCSMFCQSDNFAISVLVMFISPCLSHHLYSAPIV